MKEHRLGPRQWAFVVIAGGTVCALPFMQSRPHPSDSPQSEVDALSVPDIPVIAQLPVPALPASQTHTISPTSKSSTTDWESDRTATAASEQVAATNVPAGVEARHSPFDDLIRQPIASLPATPAPDALPLQPMRPWISAPPSALTNRPSSAAPIAANVDAQNTTSLIGSHSSPTTSAGKVSSSNVASLAASPWSDDKADATQSIATYQPERKQLSVDAWPDESFSREQVAQKVAPPQQQALVSAIMTPEQLAAHDRLISNHSPSVIGRSNSQVSPPAITRAPLASRSTAAQVRFGQSTHEPQSLPPSSLPEMTPLQSLPESRKSHVIFQPRQR